MALKYREKLMVVFAVIAIAIFIFDRVYYTPQSRKIKQFQADIKAADQKMDQFLSLTKGVEKVEPEVTRLERELKGLNERTLKGEEFRTFLRHLARESNALQMKVVSLTPHEEKLPLPEGYKGNFLYRKVTIQMVLHSTFNKFGIYLKEIEKLPYSANIDNLQIERSEEISPLLRVMMGLTIHIAGE